MFTFIVIYDNMLSKNALKESQYTFYGEKDEKAIYDRRAYGNRKDISWNRTEKEAKK